MFNSAVASPYATPEDRNIWLLRGCHTQNPPIAEIRGQRTYLQPFLGATNHPRNLRWLSLLQVY